MNTNCGIVIYTRLNTQSIEQGQWKEYPMNIKPKTLLHSKIIRILSHMGHFTSKHKCEQIHNTRNNNILLHGSLSV